jgi:hypothetical protein
MHLKLTAKLASLVKQFISILLRCIDSASIFQSSRVIYFAANRKIGIQGEICGRGKLISSAAGRDLMKSENSEKSLIDRLGIKDGFRVIILNPPNSYADILRLLPRCVNLEKELSGHLDFIQFFTQKREELEVKFPLLKQALALSGVLWISWPKHSSGIKTDLNEGVIRDIGLSNGLVDVKILAVDEIWSALKFVYRLKGRKRQLTGLAAASLIYLNALPFLVFLFMSARKMRKGMAAMTLMMKLILGSTYCGIPSGPRACTKAKYASAEKSIPNMRKGSNRGSFSLRVSSQGLVSLLFFVVAEDSLEEL